MSIKLRLVLSNIAMIIIPIILFFFASLLLVVLFLGDFREMAKFLPESHQLPQNGAGGFCVVFRTKEKVCDESGRIDEYGLLSNH